MEKARTFVHTLITGDHSVTVEALRTSGVAHRKQLHHWIQNALGIPGSMDEGAHSTYAEHYYRQYLPRVHRFRDRPVDPAHRSRYQSPHSEGGSRNVNR